MVAVAAALVIALRWPALRNIHSLAPFMIAVIITAFYGGLGPSLLAILLSCVLFDYCIAPPTGWGMADPQDRIRMVQFIVVAFFISVLHAQRVKSDKKAVLMGQRLSLALEATHLGVWDLNLNTGDMWFSASVREIYGRAGDQFAPAYEAFLEYIHVEDRDFVHRSVTRSIETAKGFNIQHRILLPSGQPRWLGTRGHVYLDDRGRPERLVAVTTDITDRPVVLAPPAAADRPDTSAQVQIAAAPTP
jgi:PAS domain-containing protein